MFTQLIPEQKQIGFATSGLRGFLPPRKGSFTKLSLSARKHKRRNNLQTRSRRAGGRSC